MQPPASINSYTNNNNNALKSKKPTQKSSHAFTKNTLHPLPLPSSSISDNNSTNAPMEEVVEEPFIKKYFYKLGPHDPPLPSARSKYGKVFSLCYFT